MEHKINSFLNKYPVIKKVIKRIYQLFFYIISSKVKFEGNISRISPNDGMEYFFGYYDKSPWDANDRYILCLRVKNTYKSVAPEDEAEIVLIDTKDNNTYRVLGTTKSWNVQQGCMLQWLGPDYSSRIIYNDFRAGEHCSVILNVKTNKERVLPKPVYTVSTDGMFALTLDFSRLHLLRPGYGYSNLKNTNNNEGCPSSPAIWIVDLDKGKAEPLMSYTDFFNFETRPDMFHAKHKVNHIMLNPSSDRFMVLHRWVKKNKRYTRLITADIDGTKMYNLNDDNMTSHCYWKNDTEILAYAHKITEGNGYYLMKDRTNEYKRKWPELRSDGHPSYSPDRSCVVTDTYPNRERMSTVYCIMDDKVTNIARVFAPFKYDNDVRCDLHPRWNRAGDKICIDSAFEGQRGLYIINNFKR